MYIGEPATSVAHQCGKDVLQTRWMMKTAKDSVCFSFMTPKPSLAVKMNYENWKIENDMKWNTANFNITVMTKNS